MLTCAYNSNLQRCPLYTILAILLSVFVQHFLKAFTSISTCTFSKQLKIALSTLLVAQYHYKAAQTDGLLDSDINQLIYLYTRWISCIKQSASCRMKRQHGLSFNSSFVPGSGVDCGYVHPKYRLILDDNSVSIIFSSFLSFFYFVFTE